MASGACTSCAMIQRSINKALVRAHLTSGPHKVDLWLSLHSQTHLAYFYVAHKKQQMIATFEPNIYYYYYYLFLLKHLDWCLLSLLNLFRGRLLVCEIINSCRSFQSPFCVYLQTQTTDVSAGTK